MKNFWNAFIPKYIPNGWILQFYRFFSWLFRMSKKKIPLHEEENRRAIKDFGLMQDGFIENQCQWIYTSFVHKSIQYSGCEVIAVYNALKSLGVGVTIETMVGLICTFERRGATFVPFVTDIGTSPLALCDYFKKTGFDIQTTDKKNAESLNTIGEKCDTIIATVYNNRNRITDMIHTVSITKNELGRFVVHNVNKESREKKGTFLPLDNSGNGYLSLVSAIAAMGEFTSPIFVLGIKR